MPIYLSQEMVDQKTGARDQAAEHLGMLEKIAAEEQELLGSRRALDGHVQMLCLSRGENRAGAGGAGAGGGLLK
jgi:hypothetical protein